MMMNEKLTISVQVADEQVKTALEGIISDAEDFMASQPRGLDHLDFLIMELDENNPTKTFSQIEANLKGFPQTDIFLTSKTIDAPTLLNAFRSGVKEFIPQPLNRDEVRQIFARAQERHQGCSVPTPSQKSTGRVISIVSGKAGAGVTTLTVNLGVSLQNLGKSSMIFTNTFVSKIDSVSSIRASASGTKAFNINFLFSLGYPISSRSCKRRWVFLITGSRRV